MTGRRETYQNSTAVGVQPQQAPVAKLRLELGGNDESGEAEGRWEGEDAGEGGEDATWQKNWTQAPYGKEALRRISDKVLTFALFDYAAFVDIPYLNYLFKFYIIMIYC